jgi:opacity protein-like surface antigen
MIRKFATVSARVSFLAALLAMLFVGAATVCAQQPQSDPPQQDSAQGSNAQSGPAQSDSTQQPQAQPPAQPSQEPSASQEAPPEETHRRVKPRDYKLWNFNAGFGGSATSGTTKTYARSGGGVVDVGVARNANRYLGLRLDAQFDNLPLHNTALQLAEAPGATSHAYSFMLDPIINIPASKQWSAYVLFGPSYIRRTGKLDSSTQLPGAPCNGFFDWWGRCFAGSLPLNQNFLTEKVAAFGFNVGGGLAYKVRSNMEVYAEFRLLHGSSNNNVTTDFRPVTVGVRW